MSDALLERLMDKVVWNGDEDECWTWEASVGSHGYGQIAVEGRPVLAHRLAYELFVGPIPAGLDLDHLCRVRPCVNPGHLEPVTRSENLRRGDGPQILRNRQLSKTHCPQGHPYSGDNLYIAPRTGYRQCRTCRKRRLRRRKAALDPN